MKKAWDSFWESKSKGEFRNLRPRQKRAINILDRYVCSGMIVCDAGCGSGFYSKYFISKGCTVYCIDYSEKALELTKKNTEGKAEYYLKRDLLDDTLSLELGNTFDLIFTDGLLEHFSEMQQRKIMNTLVAMKKENGIMVTFVPNILTYWELYRRTFSDMPGIWEKAFTMGRLTSLVKQSGQKIIEKGGVHVLPTNLPLISLEFFSRWLGSSIYIISS